MQSIWPLRSRARSIGAATASSSGRGALPPFARYISSPVARKVRVIQLLAADAVVRLGYICVARAAGRRRGRDVPLPISGSFTPRAGGGERGWRASSQRLERRRRTAADPTYWSSVPAARNRSRSRSWSQVCSIPTFIKRPAVALEYSEFLLELEPALPELLTGIARISAAASRCLCLRVPLRVRSLKSRCGCRTPLIVF